MKPFHTKNKAACIPAQDRLLLEEIKKAQSQMECAYINFQNALDPELIDYYIYEGNAAWKRYCFLLHLIREDSFTA